MPPDLLPGLLTGLRTDVFAGGLALGLAGLAMGTAGLALRRALLLVGRLWLELSVDSQSPAYRHLLLWIEEEGHLARARRLRVTELPRRGRTLGPGAGRHWFRAGGRLCRLDRDQGRVKVGAGDRGHLLETLTLGVLLGTRAEAETWLARGAGLAERRSGPRLWTFRDDWWDQVGELPARPLASVLSEGDALSTLLGDLRRFLASGPWYADRGVPWRRGYLLAGPPGTGKSSAIRALATEAGLDLATIDLGRQGLGDDALREGLASAPARALLILEDVDAAFAGREAKGGSRLTFSGLLNAIDGVGAQEGRALVLTTNHPERLDPALLRPGRVDLRLDLGPVGAEVAQAMFRRFFPGEEALAQAFARSLGPARLPPAALQGWLLAHRDDPRAAADARPLLAPDAIAAQ